MSRNLTSPLIADLTSETLYPAFLADITFTSGVSHVWSGVGPLIWNGNTYIGVGSLGQVGDVNEATEIRADGTSLTLSGIDSTLLNDCLNDIQIGAPVTVWFASLTSTGAIRGVYQLFAGTVDKPTFQTEAKTVTIGLNLENKLYNLQRPSVRRYTSADQRLHYPTDSAFSWVESLNDIALRWGS